MKINKNQTLINETNRLLDFIETVLIPANQKYIDTEAADLESLHEQFEQEKAPILAEIEKELAKGSSKYEAYEYSNMNSLEQYFSYQEAEVLAYHQQVKVHSSMYIVILVQSHIEAMLLLLCKLNLTADEFKRVSETQKDVIYEYLRVLKLQTILSDNRYQIVGKFKDLRNDYIHDQYNVKPAKKNDEGDEQENNKSRYPSLKAALSKEELANYIECAKWLLMKAYQDAKKIN